MTHQELFEKHGLKEYHVRVRYNCYEPWRLREEDGSIIPGALGVTTVQANKAAAVAAGIDQAVGGCVHLKDIISIEVEEKTT